MCELHGKCEKKGNIIIKKNHLIRIYIDTLYKTNQVGKLIDKVTGKDGYKSSISTLWTWKIYSRNANEVFDLTMIDNALHKILQQYSRSFSAHRFLEDFWLNIMVIHKKSFEVLCFRRLLYSMDKEFKHKFLRLMESFFFQHSSTCKGGV